jgi:fimbrial chaperone protein
MGKFRFITAILAVSVLLLYRPAQAQTSTLLLWPIQQAIEDDRSGSALWIENRGKTEANVQIRVFAWEQSNYNDNYSAQQQIVASPQFAKIVPGQRQLVRLMRLNRVEAGQERSFRVIVDDIPKDGGASANSGTIGLKFQMRYSLPMFVSGAGVWTKPDPQRKRAPSTATQPILAWRIASEGDKR